MQNIHLIILFQVLLVQPIMVLCRTGGDCRSMWQPSSSSSPACSSSPSTSGMQEGGSPSWRVLQSTQMTAALVTTASTAPSATGNISWPLTLSHHYLEYFKISLTYLWHYPSPFHIIFLTFSSPRCDLIGCRVNSECRHCSKCKNCLANGFCGQVCGVRNLPQQMQLYGQDCWLLS